MNDIRATSGISFDGGVSAPVSQVSDTGEALEEDQLAFNDALAKGGELNESQSPETRNAVKRSLDRIQTWTEPERASGSGASDIDAAHHSDPTRRQERRVAVAVDRDGSDSAGRFRRAADSGGKDPVPAQLRSPHASFASPPVGDGGTRDATAWSRSSAKPGPASGDRGQAGAAGGRDFAPEQARVRPALEAVIARSAPTPGMESAPPRGPGGRSTSRTQDAISGPGANDAHDADIAAVDMSGVAASSATVESGQTHVAERVQAPVGRVVELADSGSDTDDAHDADIAAVDMSGVAASSATVESGQTHVAERVQAPVGRVVELADSGSDTDDAHDADIAAVDMSGVAASSATVESGQTHVAERVQAPASHVAELAEQVADRILVSVPESDAPGEVRISLKQSILDGSEVRMFHEGGELKVVFVAETESARHLLINIKEQFQHTLGQRLQDQRVHVEVEVPERGGASGDDSRRRSRQQYVPQDDDSSVVG